MANFDVVIKGTGMGIGEEALTNNLMKGFLHTLTLKEKLPQHIIFYGEGVKLAAYGSICLEDLKALEEKGVKIMSCGICVDYYDLSDEIEVGTITTMSEVVDILSNSDSVIIP